MFSSFRGCSLAAWGGCRLLQARTKAIFLMAVSLSAAVSLRTTPATVVLVEGWQPCHTQMLASSMALELWETELSTAQEGLLSSWPMHRLKWIAQFCLPTTVCRLALLGALYLHLRAPTSHFRPMAGSQSATAVSTWAEVRVALGKCCSTMSVYVVHPTHSAFRTTAAPSALPMRIALGRALWSHWLAFGLLIPSLSRCISVPYSQLLASSQVGPINACQATKGLCAVFASCQRMAC